MPAAGLVQIVQVLLLFEPESSERYGLALWAALHEVEAFYNRDMRRMQVRRFYISPTIPSPSLLDRIRSIGQFFGATEAKKAIDLLEQEQRVATPVSAAAAAAVSSDERTYDPKQLARVAREQILKRHFTEPPEGSRLVIITDKPITPPEGWNYMVAETWPDTDPRDGVVSIAPLDPSYWGAAPERPAANHVAIVKDRARTATMSICGEFIKLKACRNPQCFRFDPIDSVPKLDYVTRLGPEHRDEAADLVGWGFDPNVTDPTLVQNVVRLEQVRPDSES